VYFGSKKDSVKNKWREPGGLHICTSCWDLLTHIYCYSDSLFKALVDAVSLHLGK